VALVAHHNFEGCTMRRQSMGFITYFSTQSGNAHAAGGTVGVANLAFISAVSEQLSVFLQGQICTAHVQ